MLDLRKSLIERRSVEVDADLAKHYLTFNTYETQRVIRLPHVIDLAMKMKNGLFRFGEVAFAVRNGDRDLMLNGQHVCSAVIESGETVPCILEKFSVKNDRELSEAFRQFEILPRSLHDMVRVEAHSLGLSWPLWLSSLIVSVATIDIANQKKLGRPSTAQNINAVKYMTKDDRVKLLGEYLKEGAFLSKVFCSDGKKSITSHLQRKAVALVIVRTWRIDKDAAYLFWSRIRDGENLTREMPEMRLREFLMKTRAITALSAYRTKKVTDHEFAYRCASAWNAFRAGRATRISYFSDKPIPKLK